MDIYKLIKEASLTEYIEGIDIQQEKGNAPNLIRIVENLGLVMDGTGFAGYLIPVSMVENMLYQLKKTLSR